MSIAKILLKLAAKEPGLAARRHQTFHFRIDNLYGFLLAERPAQLCALLDQGNALIRKALARRLSCRTPDPRLWA